MLIYEPLAHGAPCRATLQKNQKSACHNVNFCYGKNLLKLHYLSGDIQDPEFIPIPSCRQYNSQYVVVPLKEEMI